jgi:hypothetical protein
MCERKQGRALAFVDFGPEAHSRLHGAEFQFPAFDLGQSHQPQSFSLRPGMEERISLSRFSARM